VSLGSMLLLPVHCTPNLCQYSRISVGRHVDICITGFGLRFSIKQDDNNKQVKVFLNFLLNYVVLPYSSQA
jgi:hypothetical protein